MPSPRLLDQVRDRLRVKHYSLRTEDTPDREVVKAGMKVRYDPKTDTPTLVLRSTPVHESDEDKPGVILDYDREGNAVGIEILDASKRVENPHKVDCVTGAA